MLSKTDKYREKKGIITISKIEADKHYFEIYGKDFSSTNRSEWSISIKNSS